MLVLPDAHPHDPPLDIAVSHALLRRVAAGEQPPTVRLYRPGPTLAFGRLDERLPGFSAAREAGVAHGFTPLLRLAGGHAAAYDDASLIYEELVPTAEGMTGMPARFAAGVAFLAGVLADLGVDARVGQIPGEYCPGAHSVSVGGRVKVVGTAQRVVRGAAMLSAVIVVGHGPAIRDVLVDAYRALGLDFTPSTAGALDDETPRLDPAAVAAGIERALTARGDTPEPGALDAATLAAARALRARHALD